MCVRVCVCGACRCVSQANCPPIDAFFAVSLPADPMFDQLTGGSSRSKSVLAFHGSPNQNWYSIMRKGLVNLSYSPGQNNGAMLGAGIYLAMDFQLARMFAAPALTWPGSTLGTKLEIVGAYDVAIASKHVLSSLKHSKTASGDEIPDKYLLVDDNASMKLRGLCVYIHAAAGQLQLSADSSPTAVAHVAPTCCCRCCCCCSRPRAVACLRRTLLWLCVVAVVLFWWWRMWGRVWWDRARRPRS
jgi:hypothetical protein